VNTVLRLVGVEVAKVRTTRMWIGLLLGAVGLAALGAIATLAIAGTPDGLEAGLTPIETVEDVRDFVTTGSIAGVFALVLGATAMTMEHRHRTLSGTFLATPKRWPVVVAKVIAYGVAGFAFGVVGALIPLVAVAVKFAVGGEVVPFGASVIVAVLAVGAGAAFSGAMGAAAGAALRSQLIAIIGVLGWALVVESLGEEIDVKAVLHLLVLVRGEEVEEQRGELSAAQRLGDEAVARRVPSRSAAVREHHDADGASGKLERAFQRDRIGRNFDERPAHRVFASGRIGARASSAITSSSSTCANSR